jgi:DNA repair photolyase
MSRASSHALKHPPVTAPSEPAGAPSDFPELAVAIERGRRRGRGAQSNTSGRYEAEARVTFDDGWQSLEDLPPFKTTVALDTSRKVIARNDSPDIGFDRSINPYRGCEHGCVYCFARPTHAYLGLSPGLDFESKLLAKPDAPQLLEKELAAESYEPRMIAIGTNTDPYQPIERDHKEPRASTAPRRLEALRRLSEAGIPTTVMVAPVIPALNDSEMERILDAAAHAGVKEASYVLLRLPLEVRDLFREWLLANYPDRYRHVFTLIREMRGGRDYDSQWGTRMKGTGPMAWMIGRRFEIACEKLGLNKRRSKLTTDHFAKPKRSGEQLSLF